MDKAIAKELERLIEDARFDGPLPVDMTDLLRELRAVRIVLAELLQGTVYPVDDEERVRVARLFDAPIPDVKRRHLELEIELRVLRASLEDPPEDDQGRRCPTCGELLDRHRSGECPVGPAGGDVAP